MIIDTIANAHNYFRVHPLFRAAFDYIQHADLENAEGTFEIDAPNLKAIFSKKEGKSLQDAISKFECHNQHIDIQLTVSGIETYAWKPRETCEKPQTTYSAEKDVQFFNDIPDTFFQLRSGQFAIFFPEDVHAAMIGQGLIKKLVMKVKI